MTYAEVDGETVDSAATDDVDVVDVAEGARDCSVELEEAVDVAGANVRQVHCILCMFFVPLTVRRRSRRRCHVLTRTSRK